MSENNNGNKMVVIGHIEQTNDKQTKVNYEAVSGSRTVWIPNAAIEQQAKTSDGLTAFLVQNADLTHGEYDPIQQFAGGKAPLIADAAHIDVASALESGVSSANIKYLVKEQKQATPNLLGGFANNDEPDDDFDDSKPIGGIGGFDVNEEAWDGSLLAGGRKDLVAEDWRFTPVMKPLFTAYQVDEGSTPTFAPLADKKGEPIAFGVFNPTYASDQRPEGALLGTVGKDFYPQAYPVVFDGILDKASANGWKARVYAYNEGKKARLDCDVSQASQTREEARQRLKEGGHRWLDLGLMNETAKSLDGLYRYGFTINNSLDGTKALSVQAVAERVYCTNLAIMGGVQTIASIKHTKGAMKDRDWSLFSSQISDVIVDAQRSLVEMEFMQHIPVDVQLFERLITLCETKGLISWPSQKPIIKDDKVVGEKLGGGHMWRLAMDGWTKPKNDWVNVSPDQEGTLYHAYNVLNGAITHKPEWSDGKQVLKGRTVGIDTLNRRLSTVHDVMTGVLHQTITDYRSDADVDKIGKNDLSDLAGYVDEYGLTKLNDIPMMSEVLNL